MCRGGPRSLGSPTTVPWRAGHSLHDPWRQLFGWISPQRGPAPVALLVVSVRVEV